MENTGIKKLKVYQNRTLSVRKRTLFYKGKIYPSHIQSIKYMAWFL